MRHLIVLVALICSSCDIITRENSSQQQSPTLEDVVVTHHCPEKIDPLLTSDSRPWYAYSSDEEIHSAVDFAWENVTFYSSKLLFQCSYINPQNRDVLLLRRGHAEFDNVGLTDDVLWVENAHLDEVCGVSIARCSWYTRNS